MVICKMALRISHLLFYLLLVGSTLHGQVSPPAEEGPPSSPEQYEARYQERIKLSEIAGIYIPVDLQDAFTQLERLASTESLAFFREQSEDEVVARLFPKLGRWIILNWGFEGGSRLSHTLRTQGVYAPDDMSRLIMRSFHRYLNGQPLDVDGQILLIQERVAQEQLERQKEAKVIQETRRKVDPATRGQ